ncbi:MAG: homoserine dehydrogenase [Nitrospinales bacterium]
MKTIRLGLIGFGTVGAGVVKILSQTNFLIERRLGATIKLVKIADLDIKSDRGVPVARHVLTTNADDLLDHPEIDIVVELIGGLEPARSFILKAVANGKHVVTANKALLAKHGDEIFSAVEEKNLCLGYEASVGGAIPIIRSLRESFVATRFKSIGGIVNGTANYILSQMSDGGRDFDTALKEAQAQGFAEADPTFDIEGIDSAHKIAILTRLAYGTGVNFEDIFVQGISGITSEDIQYAGDFGYKIKLLAISKMDGEAIDVRVHPTMIPADNPLANVGGVLNAVWVGDEWMEKNILVGHGAGALPTGCAVLGDVAEISRNILSGASGRVPTRAFQPSAIKNIPIKNISDIECEYFLRLRVMDQPNVLSVISGILGDHSISIKSVIQKGRDRNGDGVPLVLMTHEAREKNVREALRKIDQQEVVCRETRLIRVESGT